jgi:hypothetical protein
VDHDPGSGYQWTAPVIEQDADETFNSFMDLDRLIEEEAGWNLEGINKAWHKKIERHLDKYKKTMAQESLLDFRESFMTNSKPPGFNHYCPECNRDAPAHTDDFLTFSFDENSRMARTAKDDWQCPVCGLRTDSPLEISKIYDEVIYPVTRLLLLEEKNKKRPPDTGETDSLHEAARQSINDLYTDSFEIISRDFDNRLTEEKDKYDQAARVTHYQAWELIRRKREARLLDCSEQLAAAFQSIQEQRDRLREALRGFKIDLCLPDPLHLAIPFYLVKYGGAEGKGEVKVWLPSRLEKKSADGGAVNYRLTQEEMFAPYEREILDRMKQLLESSRCKTEKVSQLKTLTKEIDKLKTADFYTQNPETFLDFIDKTYFQEQ